MTETIYELIDDYIDLIDACISNSDDSKAYELQNTILAGMERQPNWTYVKPKLYTAPNEGYHLRILGRLREALKSYRVARMEDEKQRYISGQRTQQPLITVSQHNDQHQSQSQQQTVSVSFDQVINWVQNNDSLGAAETAEILEEIKKIQAIAESPEPKKSKWEKMKPFLLWLGDKGVDLAIQVIPLILMAVK